MLAREATGKSLLTRMQLDLAATPLKCKCHPANSWTSLGCRRQISTTIETLGSSTGECCLFSNRSEGNCLYLACHMAFLRLCGSLPRISAGEKQTGWGRMQTWDEDRAVRSGTSPAGFSVITVADLQLGPAEPRLATGEMASRPCGERSVCPGCSVLDMFWLFKYTIAPDGNTSIHNVFSASTCA